MSRSLAILIAVAAAFQWCAITADAACGDYLQASTDGLFADHDLAGMPISTTAHGSSCDEAPDRPTSPTAPPRVAPVIDPAVLGRRSPAFAEGERSSWEWGDESAVPRATGRIDRPPRVG